MGKAYDLQAIPKECPDGKNISNYLVKLRNFLKIYFFAVTSTCPPSSGICQDDQVIIDSNLLNGIFLSV